jgi:hypothetical protein
VFHDVSADLELLTFTYKMEGDPDPGLLPGWDLDEWADHILGLTPRQRGYRTDHRRRGYFGIAELEARAHREIPCGPHIRRFGYGASGHLLLGDQDG